MMYKSMLQELCQKKSWTLPVYEAVKNGPDHRPHFTATVTVNDIAFESPVPCRSSKEAQHVAAQVAFNHFSSLQEHATEETAKSVKVEQNKLNGLPLAEIPISEIPIREIPISTGEREGLLHTYKNRLQIYAQKRNLSLPAYSCEIVGPPHDRRYKSKVTVDGKSFETPSFFSTLKDAEHGAAKVAFESMSLHLTQEDEVLYKTLLQEHAQRLGLLFPTYGTQRSGPSHMPAFVSTVAIGDKIYQGQEAKTKKMAEMNAAKAAYICLTECQKTQSSNYSVGETSDVSILNLQPDVTRKVEENVARKNSISSKEQAQEIQDNNGKRHINSTTSEDAHSQEEGPSTAKSPSQDPKDGASLPTLNILIPPTQTSAKRILVCPRTPGMIIPEGATLLPNNDDQWVAMAMTLPEEEYEKYYN